MATTEKHEKNVSLAKINLSEAEDLIATNNPDDMAMAYEKLGEIIKRLELSKDKTMQYLMEKDEDLENLKAWAEKQKDCIRSFRKSRDNST
jgi:gamma-glutamyl phosphate reductase